MVWDRNTNEHQIRQYDEIAFFGEENIMSPSGRYLLSECYRPNVPGKRYALLDAETGRLIRLLEYESSVLTSACFSQDDRYVFFSAQFKVIKTAIDDSNATETEWLCAPDTQHVIGRISCGGDEVLSIYRSVWNRSSSAVRTTQYRCTRDEWGPIVREIPGWVFDCIPSQVYQAFYDQANGHATVVSIATAKEMVFLTARAPILAGMQEGSEERKIADEILKYPGVNPEIISFGYPTLTPDGRYCVFVLNSSARMRGLLVFYNLEKRVWKALAVGNKDAGGLTRLAFPAGTSSE